MGKTPKTMREAIENTLELHEAVLDGDFDTYEEAKAELHNDECPLCCYADYRKKRNNSTKNSCWYCPWLKFEKEKCTDTNRLDYEDSDQSFDRLHCWLKGESFGGNNG